MSAAQGGCTTVFEHPISTPPPYNQEILENRIACAQRDAVVDVAFFGAAGGEFPEEIAHCDSRPPVTEYETVSKMIHLAYEAGTVLDLVHLSTPEAVELAKQARYRGQKLLIETCPHKGGPQQVVQQGQGNRPCI